MASREKLRTFDGGTAIVTGGASGIGRALAEELAKQGCEVVLADRQTDLAEKVANEILASGGKATSVELNVTDFPAVEKLVRDTVSRTGRLDYIFNNAGIGLYGDMTHHTMENWNYILDVNLRGVIHGAQAAYGIMTSQGFGHIVNTASLAGLIPSPGNVSYATTKYAVVGFSQSLRAEAISHGVRVSAFCPGFIRTAILNDGGEYGRDLTKISSRQKQMINEIIEKLKPMPANIFAKKALEQVANNKAIIVLPSRWKLFWWFHRLAPSLGLRQSQKFHQDFQKQLRATEEGGLQP